MNLGMKRLSRRAAFAAVALSSLVVNGMAWSGSLENPANNGFVSGISVVSGWNCSTGTLTFTVDGGASQPLASGTPRADIQSGGLCASLNSGFGALINWSIFSEGEHTVRVFDNGVEFGSSTIMVTKLGVEFLTGASGVYKLFGFPATGTDSVVVWDQSQQNFQLLKAGYYHLHSRVSESALCLLGSSENLFSGGGSVGQGAAAVLDTCGFFTDVLWKIVPFSGGYFQLQTNFSEGQGKCLESNDGPNTGVAQAGATYMTTCAGLSGQLWKLIPNSSGYFTIKSAKSEASGRCLESNSGASSGASLGGAAFMDNCRDSDGQQWKLSYIETAGRL